MNIGGLALRPTGNKLRGMQVALFAVQSLDGYITRRQTAGDAFASEADRVHFREAIRACDACVMGGTTYDLSKARMRPEAFPALRRVVWTRNPEARAAERLPGVLEFTSESPVETAARLRADGRRRCAVLGGGQVNAAWLEAGLVDELWLTVESALFGEGTPLAGSHGRPGTERRLLLREAKVLAEGGPVLLRYEVQK